MNQPGASPGSDHGVLPPILLATDLSARCDRAGERAAQLASQWNAVLHVLHVTGAADAKVAAEHRIRADLQNHPVRWDARVVTGEPSEVILRTATELGCGLVVTGPGRPASLARHLLGTALDALVRRAPMPVLVVRTRADRPYGPVLVASDFSEPSRLALQWVLRLFPDCPVTLLHAYQVPFEGFISRTANEEEFHAAAQAELQDFLARVEAAPEPRDRVAVRLAYGPAQDVVFDHARDGGADLVALGTQGRTGMAGFLVGSTAERLLATLPCDVLPCDVLMVRGTAAPTR